MSFTDILEKVVNKSIDTAFDNIDWITVKGNHIPVKEGENKKEAIKEFFESKKENNNKYATNVKELKQGDKFTYPVGQNIVEGTIISISGNRPYDRVKFLTPQGEREVSLQTFEEKFNIAKNKEATIKLKEEQSIQRAIESERSKEEYNRKESERIAQKREKKLKAPLQEREVKNYIEYSEEEKNNISKYGIPFTGNAEEKLEGAFNVYYEDEAKERQKELLKEGKNISLEQILGDMKEEYEWEEARKLQTRAYQRYNNDIEDLLKKEFGEKVKRKSSRQSDSEYFEIPSEYDEDGNTVDWAKIRISDHKSTSSANKYGENDIDITTGTNLEKVKQEIKKLDIQKK